MESEFMNERNLSTAARKQLEDSVSRQAVEVKEMSVNLQQSTAKYDAEVASLRADLHQTQIMSVGQLNQMKLLHQEEKKKIEFRCVVAEEKVVRIKKVEEILHGELTAMEAKVKQLEQALEMTNKTAERTNQSLEDRTAIETQLRNENQELNSQLSKWQTEFDELKRKETKPLQVHQILVSEMKKLVPELDDVPLGVDDTTSLAALLTSQMNRIKDQEINDQVQQYKTVLAQTEQLLDKLQSRIETQEGQWVNKIISLESEIQVLKEERQFRMDQGQQQIAVTRVH